MEVGGQAAFEGWRKCRSCRATLPCPATDRTPLRVNCRRCRPAGADTVQRIRRPSKTKLCSRTAWRPRCTTCSDETLQPAPSPHSGGSLRATMCWPRISAAAQGPIACRAMSTPPLPISIARSRSNRRRSITCSAAVSPIWRREIAISRSAISPRCSISTRAMPLRSEAGRSRISPPVISNVRSRITALLIRLNPRNARAFYLRGLAERELQEFDRALDDFNADDPDRRRERHGRYSACSCTTCVNMTARSANSITPSTPSRTTRQHSIQRFGLRGDR